MAEGNGTRGLSQRELILILMGQVEKLVQGMGKRPTRTEVYATLGAVAILLTIGQAFLP